MDPSNLPLIFVFFVLVMLSSYFSCAESAFAHMNKIKIKSLADAGDKRAKRALKIFEDFDNTITTLLIGNNIVNTFAASIVTVLAIRIFTQMSESQAGAIATAVTTVVVFVFGEMLPKSYANANSDRLVLKFASSLKFFSVIFYPFVFVFSKIALLSAKIFKVKDEPTVTEEELSDIIDSVEEEGTIDGGKSELLQSALEFSRRTVANVLTLKDDIDAIDIKMTNAQILQYVKTHKHSRLPVYSADIDHIIGVLHVRRFLSEYIKDKNVKLRNIISKPYFVSLDTEIDGLLDDMSLNKTHMAIARDKNGHVIGLVTIEDFVEELVGEIYDEDDVVNSEFVKLGGNCFEVSAQMELGKMFDCIRYFPKKPVSRKKSVGSWVLECLGRTPREDDEFTFDRLTVTVTETEDGRVDKVEVKLDTPELDEAISHLGEKKKEVDG